MIQTPSYQFDRMLEWETHRPDRDRPHVEIVAAAQRHPLDIPNSPDDLPARVRLDFEGLNRFEVVEKQYSQWGVTFANAIAIQPSNPSFPPHSGQMVVMGAPKNGSIELTFQYPIRFFSAFVTSSRGTMLSAFDLEDRLLAQDELAESNLNDSNSCLPANSELIVRSENIYRILFYALQGQLVVDDISFGF
jgi:hypothetical protein